MATHISHSCLPYPIKNARFTLEAPFLDADGDPTDPTTPDTEVSQDGGSYADAAEEVTMITGSNGSGYVTLTGAETNNSLVFVAMKVASGPKATLATLKPRNLAIVGSGTLSAGSAGGGTLGTLLAYDVTGCFIRTTGGTGGGGTGGANNQARRIITYNTGTGAFTVSPNWETTPSTDTTYDVLLPEGVTLGMLKTLNPATAGRSLVVDAAGLADANVVKLGPSGSGTAQTAKDLGAINVTNLNTLSGHDPGGTLASTTNITAAAGCAVSSIGTDVITSTALAASAVTEIWAAVTDSSGVTTLLSRLSSARAGYLDNINNSNLASVPAFPSNFPSLGINASGHVSRVTLTDTATTLTNAPSDSSGVTTLLSRLTATRAGYIDNLSSAPPTASAIADQVWDEILSGHAVSGSTGEALSAAGGAGDPWITALPGSYSSGQAGYILGTYLDAAISGRATNAGVWSNGTRNLTALGFTLGASDFGTDWLTSTGLAASAVSEIWAAVADSPGVTTLLSRLSSTRAGYLDNLSAGAAATAASISALNNISSSDVLTQVNSGLDAALTLPGGNAPSDTPSLRAALAQLYQQAIRPYEQDASEQRIYSANGLTELQKRTVADDGTTLTYGPLIAA